ncbi:MAG: hypothetical protein O2799_08800 [Planctomycetota bacterium]|nr:hypothetical protein [Planctomycetota bacterium]
MAGREAGAIVLAIALALAAGTSCVHLERTGGDPPAEELAYCFVAMPVLRLEQWEVTEPGAWSVVEDEGGPWLELAPAEGAFAYQPPHRSPHRIALLRDLIVGEGEESRPMEVEDFELSFEAMSTGRRYGHRDLCVFFGWQAPDRFHYLHLAPAPDPNAHNLFLVDGAPRRSLEPVFEEGLEWPDDTWVSIVVRRRGDTVTVHADGRLVLSSDKASLRRGRVGIGTFDDSGRWRNLRLQGAPRGWDGWD